MTSHTMPGPLLAEIYNDHNYVQDTRITSHTMPGPLLAEIYNDHVK